MDAPCNRYDLVELTFRGAHGCIVKTAEISAVSYSEASGVGIWCLVLLPCDLPNSVRYQDYAVYYYPERPMNGLKEIRVIGNNNPKYIEKLTKN